MFFAPERTCSLVKSKLKVRLCWTPLFFILCDVLFYSILYYFGLTFSFLNLDETWKNVLFMHWKNLLSTFSFLSGVERFFRCPFGRRAVAFFRIIWPRKRRPMLWYFKLWPSNSLLWYNCRNRVFLTINANHERNC